MASLQSPESPRLAYKDFPLTEILSCFICKDKPKDHRMCPNCSKLFCKNCIQTKLHKLQRCPSCKIHLIKDSLVECKFLKPLIEYFEVPKDQDLDYIEKCSIHNTELGYYCITCSQAICADCAILTPTHKGHNFERLSSIYQVHYDLITQELVLLKDRIEELTDTLAEIDLKVKIVEKKALEHKGKLNLALDSMQERLDFQLQESLQGLYDIKEQVYEEISSLEQILEKVEKKNSRESEISVIKSSAGLLKEIKDASEKPCKEFEILNLMPEFYSELAPEYIGSIFIVQDYKKLKSEKEIIFSEHLCVNTTVWRLKIYPNGNGAARGNYISIFLELVKGRHESIKYEYKIEMINHSNPDMDLSREFMSDFEEGECWGYNRFFRLDLLEEEGYINDLGCLVLKYYVRPFGYIQLVQDQKDYISHLIKKKDFSEKKVQELSSKLQNYEKTPATPQKSEENEGSLRKSYIEIDSAKIDKINIESQIPPHHTDQQINLPDFSEDL